MEDAEVVEVEDEGEAGVGGHRRELDRLDLAHGLFEREKSGVRRDRVVRHETRRRVRVERDDRTELLAAAREHRERVRLHAVAPDAPRVEEQGLSVRLEAIQHAVVVHERVRERDVRKHLRVKEH